MTRILIVLCAVWLMAAPAFAKLKIVATTTDLQAIVQVVAGDLAKISAICPAGSDPHFLEARPSQIVKVRGADLLVSNGAELELGWLPLMLSGARRSDLAPGAARHFQAADHVDLIDVPAAGTTRDAGDVHALGNPHFMLDPLRAAKVGLALAEKLAALDSGQAAQYRAAAKAFEADMQGRLKGWKSRVAATGIKKIVAHHKDLNYLLSRLELEPGVYIEPKPGLPPTAKHLAQLVEIVKTQGIKLAVISHLYPGAPAEKVATSVKGFRWVRVPGQVGAMKGAETLPALYEQVVAAIEKP